MRNEDHSCPLCSGIRTEPEINIIGGQRLSGIVQCRECGRELRISVNTQAPLDEKTLAAFTCAAPFEGVRFCPHAITIVNVKSSEIVRNDPECICDGDRAMMHCYYSEQPLNGWLKHG